MLLEECLLLFLLEVGFQDIVWNLNFLELRDLGQATVIALSLYGYEISLKEFWVVYYG